MKDDSIEGIFDTLKNCALSQNTVAGLAYMSMTSVAEFLHQGTNGTSNGIIPMLSVYNKTAMYVDQCFRGDTHVYTDNCEN